MFRTSSHSPRTRKLMLFTAAAALALTLPVAAHAADKKKKPAPAAAEAPGPRKFPFDPKKLVWPTPPNVGRIHWLDYFAGMKIDYSITAKAKPKASWMDRLAGDQPESEKVARKDFPYQMIGPAGMAVDSKGNLYVADQKVGAIFIYNTETHDCSMIRNGVEAHFAWINGIAIDDDDRVFVSDGQLHRVLVFGPNHQVDSVISEGMNDPNGIAIDTTNRLLYVVDTQLDQVLVYDVDSFKLLRRIGTGGKNHYLQTPGDFGAPQGVALDKDGNVYVTDTLNNRVEIFDADGNFISTFGKIGDGPGYFARPKGIAIDSDGHVWVADQFQDRLQVFNRDGRLLAYIGQTHSQLPGQFNILVGVAIDKKNHVFTSEQYPGRVQMFQYVTDSEAEAIKAQQAEEREKAAEAKRTKGGEAAPAPTPATDQKPAADAPKP